MSILKSLKTAAQESHPEGHARIHTFVKATLLKTEQITKTIAVETIGNALVIADPRPRQSKRSSTVGGRASNLQQNGSMLHRQ